MDGVVVDCVEFECDVVIATVVVDTTMIVVIMFVVVVVDVSDVVTVMTRDDAIVLVAIMCSRV